MIISLENKYIFIEVPKTGSTSIQNFLLNNDPTTSKNKIEIDGISYSFLGHHSALQIRNILGEHYQKFQKFGFIRHPHSRLISSYHFYKNGKPIAEGNKNPWPAYIRILFARILPFKIWALLYPYKSNIEHLVDTNGQLIVNLVGTFECLSSDMAQIISKLGLELDVDKLPHTNKSKHDGVHKYFGSPLFCKIIHSKIKHDLDFYQKYAFKLSRPKVR